MCKLCQLGRLKNHLGCIFRTCQMVLLTMHLIEQFTDLTTPLQARQTYQLGTDLNKRDSNDGIGFTAEYAEQLFVHFRRIFTFC